MNVGAVAAVVELDGKILAVSRRGEPDDLGFPGGKVEPGEHPDDALCREVAEEVGLVVARFEVVGERTAGGFVVRYYRVLSWLGVPFSREAGCRVEWVEPARLVEPNCSFGEYNRVVLTRLGHVPQGTDGWSFPLRRRS